MKKKLETKYTIADIPTLEKKYDKARNAVLANPHLDRFYSYNTFEIDYLLSGHATELIETITVRPKPPGMDWKEYRELQQGKIYGVVAKDRETCRYVWFYLRHNGILIRCNSLEDANKKADLLKAWNELEDIIDYLEEQKYKQEERQKKAKAKRLKATKSVTKKPVKKTIAFQGSSLRITKKVIKPATVVNKKTASKKVA